MTNILNFNFSPIQALGSIAIKAGINRLLSFNVNNPLKFKQRFSDEEIRLSLSYLYRIAIKDKVGNTKYLLVKSNRVENMYQPVGGVYKYFDSNVLNEYGARDHNEFHEKNDLRIILPMKNVGGFMRKFKENKKGWRESQFFREFDEELLTTGILPSNLFNLAKLQFQLIHHRNSGFRYSPYFKCNEIVYYDIISISFDAQQNKFLQQLMENEKLNDFIFADENELRTMGYDYRLNKHTIRISEHSHQII